MSTTPYIHRLRSYTRSLLVIALAGLVFPLPFARSEVAPESNAKVEQPKPNTKLKGYDPNHGTGKRIFEIPIEGTIDLGLAAFVERVLREATPNDVVFLRIKTFGGRVDAAVRIRDALLESKAPTVAYVDHRAISAGALITLATDTVLMSDGASIGAATPVQQAPGGEAQPTSEKVVSYMRSEMRATAEAKGRRADVAEAMVDPDVEIPGVSPKGKLLTLTGDQAVKLKIADAIVPSYDNVAALLNLGQAEVVRRDTHWGEDVARFLTEPTVSSLLMTLGFLGLLMELYTPGFSLAGLVGVTCLSLFFFGQYSANLAGWEELLLFIVGLILLGVEIFLIPGFGVAGILGLVAMGAALVMAMFELEIPWDVSFELGYAQDALTVALLRLLGTLVVVGIAAYLLAKYLPRSILGRWLILQPAAPTDAAQTGTAMSGAAASLLGKTGRAITPLRPAGVVEIDGHRVDVVTDGSFIDRDAWVVVTEIAGSRVVVAAHKPS